MKVDIGHIEKSQGLIFKKTLYGVALTVTFSEEEREIITSRRLEHDRILERGAPADVNAEKHARRGVARKLATVATGGRDALTFDLTVAKLLKGTDTYFFDTPLEAKEYTEQLRVILPRFKQYIVENAGIEEKRESFEL